MNVSTLHSVQSEPALPEQLLAQLGALPDFAPPADGFARVLALRTAERRRRVALAIAAGVAAIAVTAGLLRVGPLRVENVAPPATPLAARSQALEADVRDARTAAVASAPIPAPVSALEGELARLDAALQSAYDRGAPADELDRLWRARTDTMSALVAAYKHSNSIVRI